MKLFVCIAFALALSVVQGKVYHPHRISYEDLVNDADDTAASLVDVLSKVGMVSITETPFSAHKNNVLSTLHACALKSKTTKEHVFPDGTVRLTMATHTVPGGMQTMNHEAPEDCHDFTQATHFFRKGVEDVTRSLSTRLASVLDLETPLLSTKHGEYPFSTLADVVENGEHLEHFHSYQATHKTNDLEETIELHTDQGLFLVFTPGLMVSKDEASALTGGFFIELQDGSLAEVEFSNKDDLIIMLGDGVNQYINPKLRNGMTPLRAVPHTLTVPQLNKDKSRVWYGRMVLPPADAVHPQYNDKTFGELRQIMINASLSKQDDTNDALGLGCSSTMMARQLEETTCEADTLLCWHRCMNTTEFGVSDEICAEQNLSMLCINPRGQITDGSHGDYYPGCIDPGAEIATPYPNLPTYPRDDDVCTDEMWADFSASTGYDDTVDLGNGAVFMWSVVDNQVDGRLAFNGLFGYLAFGFAKIDGAKNGMHGATIIMALPGSNYSAVEGLDLTMGSTVNEYVIDPDSEKSAFRHWMTPVTSVARSLDTYQVNVTDCFAAMTFKTGSIHNMEFNLTGTDELIWAANAVDYYAGYHGEARGRFSVDWPKGMAMLDEDIEDHSDHDHENGTTTESTSSGATAIGRSSLAAMLIAMIMGVNLHL